MPFVFRVKKVKSKKKVIITFKLNFVLFQFAHVYLLLTGKIPIVFKNLK